MSDKRNVTMIAIVVLLDKEDKEVHILTDYEVINDDCLDVLKRGDVGEIHTTFFDPPFNQGKKYEYFDDNQDPKKYWSWITQILEQINDATVDGGALFFMHREKNIPEIFAAMKEADWTYRNLIIWRKMSYPSPFDTLLSKRYQVIFYGIKGDKPRVFNRLKCNAPMLSWHKELSDRGTTIDDVWYDIREMTAGYLAGKEVLREKNGEKSHYQQMPLALPLRAILMSTLPHDTIFDPMMGSGTTLVTAQQLNRHSIGIDIDPKNCGLTYKRLKNIKLSDDLEKLYGHYSNTPNLDEIWGYRKQQTLESFI